MLLRVSLAISSIRRLLYFERALECMRHKGSSRSSLSQCGKVDVEEYKVYHHGDAKKVDSTEQSMYE